jgi:rubrerythrin
MDSQGGIMQTYSIREIVEMALQTEKTGYAFYTGMMEKFKEHEGLKDLFGRLAEQEQVHEQTFEKLLEKVSDAEPEGWDEVQPYFRAMVESEFFLGKGKALPSMDHVKEVMDAVNFAIGFEKETVLYFLGLRDAVKDKGIVDEIINEEKSHILWLVRFRETL